MWCIICRKLIAACNIQCKSPSQRPEGLITLHQFTVHGETLSVCVRESHYVRSRVRCGTVQQTLFLHVSLIFQRRESDANKQDFNIKLSFTCQAESTPKPIEILTKVFSSSDRNLVVLACMDDELSCGQAQNGVNFDPGVKFDLDGQGQSHPKSIGIFYTYGPHLVILA